MQLSIVIVNYNVKYFLDLALSAVYEASNRIDVEIIVVDNASTDGSLEFLRQKHPQVHFISNEKNLGFARANNIGIKKAEGKFVLLLNPDTIIAENTLTQCLDFMNKTKDAGAVGVRMVDGSGSFLKESKRSFPDPMVSFYKLFGLSKLFPKSEKFGKYHLSYLPENEINAVDVLSGAFMFIRKDVLEKAGLLDEDYFMYGEDIDLSYKLTKTGYKNYYLPTTTIIHFKGESTKRSSLKFVNTFYKAMAVFASKHLKGGKSTLMRAGVSAAIFFRGLLSALGIFFRKIGWLMLEIGLSLTVLFMLKELWAELNPLVGKYPNNKALLNFGLYIPIWLITVWLSGGYDRPFRGFKLFRGMFIGSLIVAAIYGFLPENLRFSRAILALGAVAVFIILWIIRVFRHYMDHKTLVLGKGAEKRRAIVGDRKEGERVLGILEKLGTSDHFFGIIKPGNTVNGENYLGMVSEINEIVDDLQLNELILCGKNLNADAIIDLMGTVGAGRVRFKIISEHSDEIIGSDSPKERGHLYTNEGSLGIATQASRRNKRFFDLLSALILLLLSFIVFFFQNKKGRLLRNISAVLLGKKTWVSYIPTEVDHKLPKLKEGILNQLSNLNYKNVSDSVRNKLNQQYARGYTVTDDIQILLKNWKHLGS